MTEIRDSPKRWARAGRLSTLFAQGLTPPRSPLLLLSLPRCGSSWVGKTIGQSSQGLYLREPMNQSKLEIEGGPTVFMIRGKDEAAPPRAYRTAADDAFRGLPKFSRRVVKDPDQWRLDRILYTSHIRGGRVVIKDVNPLALRWLLDNYRFKLIFLTRHPASVAASWHRMGWTEGVETRLKEILGPELFGEITPRHMQSFWTRHGAMQALVYRHVFDVLESVPDGSYEVISYESLCKSPEQAFGRLFRFAGFSYGRDDRERIRTHSSRSEGRKTDPYSTHRESADMVDAWKRDLSMSEQAEVRDSHLSLEPPIYGRSTWR